METNEIEDHKLNNCAFCSGFNCVKCETRESSCGGYSDDRYQCIKCHKVWWVEGIDS